MEETCGFMSIGVFARKVGLAPSALRFYDDCGLLPPARVEPDTGYRHYTPEQQERAVLIRRLRDAGMPLADTTLVLDGPAEQARDVLRQHAERTRAHARAARTVIAELLDAQEGGRTTRTRIGGPELARALSQVSAATARGADLDRFPVLGCVLLEADRDELRLAATDRYRLSVRTLRARTTGAPRHAAVPAQEWHAAIPWLLPRPEVGLELDGTGVVLHDGPDRRALPACNEEFPSYRLVLEGLAPALHRVITARRPLAALLASPAPASSPDSGPGAAVCVQVDEGRLTVDGTELPAVCTGPPVRVLFDPRTLLPALEAGVGPDVLLEISAADRPVVVRSADQGGFTTLAMPVHPTRGQP